MILQRKRKQDLLSVNCRSSRIRIVGVKDVDGALSVFVVSWEERTTRTEEFPWFRVSNWHILEARLVGRCAVVVLSGTANKTGAVRRLCSLKTENSGNYRLFCSVYRLFGRL